MTIDHKTFVPHELKLSEEGTIRLAFAQLNVVDLDGDVTFPGAIPSGKSVPMSAYGHTSWKATLPVGKGVISEVGDLAVFDGQFFMGTPQGHATYETVKAMGDLQEFSHGYQVLSGPRGTFKGESVRELRKLDIFEISPVFKGAGIGTGVLSIKSGAPGPDAPYAEHATWVRDALKAFLERTDERAEWRSKEGRTLSAANRAALIAMLESLDLVGGTAEELRRILDATDPDKADRQLAQDILVQIGIARSLGVPV